MSPLAREILGGGVPSRTCSILPTGKRRWARAARIFSGDTGTVRRLCVVHALRRLLGVLRACQGAVGCRARKSAAEKKTRMQRFFLVFYGHLVSALQLKLFRLGSSMFYFKLQDTDTDGCGLVAELFGYGLSQLQVKVAPRSSHSTVS